MFSGLYPIYYILFMLYVTVDHFVKYTNNIAPALTIQHTVHLFTQSMIWKIKQNNKTEQINLWLKEIQSWFNVTLSGLFY